MIDFKSNGHYDTLKRTYTWLTCLRWLALAVGVLAFLSYSTGTSSALLSDVDWSAEISLPLTPERVAQFGGLQGVGVFQNALGARLANEGVSFEWKPQTQASTGDLTLALRGTGLPQFKQVMFIDLVPAGGWLNGPAALTLTGSAAAGESLNLSLESNRSTGYAWELDRLDASVLKSAGPSEFSVKGELFGAAAKQTVRLQALKAGTTTLSLVYRRPWMKGETPTRKVTLKAARIASLADLTNPASIQSRPTTPKTDAAPRRIVPVTLPAVYDLRPQMPPVRNQGGCGSCWAFATVGPMESNLLIGDGIAANLSEQYLVSCNNSGWSCDGGWWAHAYHLNTLGQVQSQAGAVLENDFPYVGYDAACNKAYSHPYRLISWHSVKDDWSIPSETAIKEAILNYGPVSSGVCSSSFSGYTGGVFTNGASCLDHAIVLVGWDDRTSPPSWILRNSWGSGWGLGGYMYISRTVAQVGYAANYVTVLSTAPKYYNYLPFVAQ